MLALCVVEVSVQMSEENWNQNDVERQMKIIMTWWNDLLFFVLLLCMLLQPMVSGVLKAINIKGNLPQAIDDGAPRLIKRHSEFLI